MTQDEKFMSLALELALNGRGGVEPNPMVGAMIVRDGVEIARGWHRRFGGPHAEIEALSAASEAGADVRGATMYVTLEPCCHFGKTPPCTDAIITAGLAKVVAAMQDVDARVAGKGFERLRHAGIEVVSGVCEQQARKMLSAYIKLRTKGRPWVICKWAQTADGFISLPAGDSRKWISSEASRRRVHEVRAYCDGILAGIGTVLADDPLLTNRSGSGKEPTPVVLDAELRTPADCRLMRAHALPGVIIATTASAVASHPEEADELHRAGAELLALPSRGGMLDLGKLLDELGGRQWTYLLVEGGAQVHRSFLAERLADEILVFVSPQDVGKKNGDILEFSRSGNMSDGNASSENSKVSPFFGSLARLDIGEIRRHLSLEDVEESELDGDRVIQARLRKMGTPTNFP